MTQNGSRNTPAVFAVGFDTARYGHHVTFLNEQLQHATGAFHFTESAEGYGKLREAFEKLSQRGPVQFRLRVDAAGQYAENLLGYLHQLPFKTSISVGEPKRNKDYRSVHFPKRKADEVDSLACARFAMVENPAPTLATPPEFLQLREVVSAYEAQTKRTTRLTNQLHNRLSRVFPELATLNKRLTSQYLLKLLAKYPTAERVAAARLSSIKAIRYMPHDTAHQIHALAKESIACSCGTAIEEMMRNLVGELQQSLAAEKNLEKATKKALADLPPGNHRYVQTIPGIGEMTAAALIAKIIDIDRFETPDGLVNYFGVFPEENTSGVDKRGNKVPQGKMEMSNKGNDLVRKLLYMCSLSALKDNPAIKPLYARQMANNKSGNVALGHCMRKLLHLVFAVWKTGKPFDPKHYPWIQAESGQGESSSTTGQTSPATTVEGNAAKEKAAGRKGQSPKGQAVTAAQAKVRSSSTLVKQQHKTTKPAKTSSVPLNSKKKRLPENNEPRKPDASLTHPRSDYSSASCFPAEPASASSDSTDYEEPPDNTQ